MNPWAGLSKISPAQLRRMQDERLRRFINIHLYPFSPHYQKLFREHGIDPKSVRSVKDLARIPLTSKMDFVDTGSKTERFRDFVIQPDAQKIRSSWPVSKTLPLAVKKLFRGQERVQDQLAHEYRPVFMTFTTGTTNTPVPFLYSSYDIENLHVSGARMMHLFRIDPSQRIVNMFPYAPHLAFWQVVFGGFASRTLAMSTGGGKVMGTEGNISVILKMKPQMLLGVPSYVYHVLRVAKEQGVKMPSVKKVVLGAAKVTQGFKQKLAEILAALGSRDVSIFGTYGFTEARAAWAECPTALDDSSGYHLYPDKEIFEVIDPKTGKVKDEGEDGELVYTALDARASAVLRYRTGDFVKGGITAEPCPHCGLTVPRISSDITRLSDVKDQQLSKVKGALVNFNHFSAVLSGVKELDEWQVELRKKDNDPFEVDELVVYLCAKEGCDQARLAEDIKKKLSMATEVTPNTIEFISMPEMVKRLELEVANKEKRILDSRPKHSS